LKKLYECKASRFDRKGEKWIVVQKNKDKSSPPSISSLKGRDLEAK
jgi:hypothetical protein